MPFKANDYPFTLDTSLTFHLLYSCIDFSFSSAHWYFKESNKQLTGKQG